MLEDDPEGAAWRQLLSMPSTREDEEALSKRGVKTAVLALEALKKIMADRGVKDV